MEGLCTTAIVKRMVEKVDMENRDFTVKVEADVSKRWKYAYCRTHHSMLSKEKSHRHLLDDSVGRLDLSQESQSV